MTGRILTILGLAIAGLAIAVVTGWGALVLFYLAPGSGTMRTALAWSFAAMTGTFDLCRLDRVDLVAV